MYNKSKTVVGCHYEKKFKTLSYLSNALSNRQEIWHCDLLFLEIKMADGHSFIGNFYVNLGNWLLAESNGSQVV